jgi:hypothetical protein
MTPPLVGQTPCPVCTEATLIKSPLRFIGRTPRLKLHSLGGLPAETR